MSNPVSTPVQQTISDYLATIGAAGGKAGKGSVKERDNAHYRRISALGVAKRLENAKKKLASKKRNLISPNVCNDESSITKKYG
jgi:hypothetical protein